MVLEAFASAANSQPSPRWCSNWALQGLSPASHQLFWVPVMTRFSLQCILNYERIYKKNLIDASTAFLYFLYMANTDRRSAAASADAVSLSTLGRHWTGVSEIWTRRLASSSAFSRGGISVTEILVCKEAVTNTPSQSPKRGHQPRIHWFHFSVTDLSLELPEIRTRIRRIPAAFTGGTWCPIPGGVGLTIGSLMSNGIF